MTPTVTQPEAFSSLLLTCSIKGTMFLLLVGMLALWTRSASCRHYVWICGFLCLGALMVIDPFVPHWQVLPAWEATPIVTAIEPWLLPIWCIGALLFCSKVLLGLIALFRIERTSTELASDPWSTLVSECRQDLGIHKPVRLLHFPGRIMPMTWGVLRNFVVLPSSAARWSAQRVRAVLMHELAHIRRGDYVASLLRDAVCAFYWFHPLVWWAAKEMDEDREEASDDAVIAAGQQPADYACHLATVATRGLVIDPQIRPKVALAEKPLMLRVRSILTPWKCRHPITPLQRFQLGTALVLMLASLLLIGPRQPWASSALTKSQSNVFTKAPAYFSSVHGNSALPLHQDQLPEAIVGWNPPTQRLDIKGETLTVSSALSTQRISPSKLDNLDAAAIYQRQISDTNGSMVTASTVSSGTQTNSQENEDLTWILTSPEYSTSPPEKSEEGPETISISEVFASLENVGHIAVDGFDLGKLGGEASEGSGTEPVIDFEFDNIQFDQGFFSTASLTKSPTILPNSTVKKAPKQDTVRQVPSANGVGSAKIAPPAISEAHTRPDAGLVTQIRFATHKVTGEPHLAITFKRKGNGPTASFRFEASPDMATDNWAFDPEHFVLIAVDGNGVTIALTEAVSVSPFRFLRIRSSSPLPRAASPAPAAKE
ncbi:MAG: M56 family metallopeptidase [Verrucomicrobiales bacterium]|nr:M56 family metallopeptidase [Verrucomicrobiales bacterium]